MAKPSIDPTGVFVAELQTGTTTHVTAPSGGQPTSGYSTGYRPGAYEHNWLFGVLFWWATYLKNLESEILTWTALNTFTGGLISNGVDATGSGGLAGKGATIKGGDFVDASGTNLGEAGSALSLIAGWLKTGANGGFTGNGLAVHGAFIRNNANTDFKKGTLNPVQKIFVGAKQKPGATDAMMGIGLQIEKDTSVSYTNTGGPNDGTIGINVATPDLATVKLARGPTAWFEQSTDLRDILCAMNIPAVVGSVQIGGSAGSPTVNNAVGIKAVSYQNTNTTLRIEFGKLGTGFNMSNTLYTVITGPLLTNGFVVTSVQPNVAYVDLSVMDIGTATLQNLNTIVAQNLHITVFGTWA